MRAPRGRLGAIMDAIRKRMRAGGLLACLVLAVAAWLAMAACARADQVYACDDPRFLAAELGCTADAGCSRVPKAGDVFPLRKLPEACDLTKLGVAIEDGGRLQKLYGGGKGAEIAPSEAIDPVIDHLVDAVAAKAAAAGGTIRILIFAHGGLVGHGEAMSEAQLAAPYVAADGYVPLFLMWESGLVPSYGDSLCCVVDGEFQITSRLPLEVTRPGTDVVTSFAQAPQTLDKQWLRFRSTLNHADEEYYLRPSDLTTFCSALGSYYVDAPPRPPEDAECPSLRIPDFGAGGYLNEERYYSFFGGPGVVYAALTPPRWLLTYLLPEFGAQAWGDMLRQTRMALAFAPPATSAPVDDSCEQIMRDADAAVGREKNGAWTYKGPKGRSPYGDGGFSIFFDRLSCEIRRGRLKPYADRLEIDFYGHSMGALIGNEILSRYSHMRWGRVVYMAAASSIRDVRLTVAPALRLRDANAGPRPPMQFYSLMLHPLAESQEQEGWGLPPQGSLLEWIDEMFEHPRSVEDRTFGKWRNIRQAVRLFPDDVRGDMHFRVFARQDKAHDLTEARELACRAVRLPSDPPSAASDDPMALPICNPTRHGDFTDYAFWRTAFVTGCASALQVAEHWKESDPCPTAAAARP